MQSQRAFTLIELSIVLVIIGLIVGGVLVGKDLIQTATLRAIVTQREQIITAVQTFKSKYNGIPGDLANATNFGFTANGNGNGLIGQFPTGATYGEVWQFPKQLSEAGLIAGTYTGSQGTGGARHAAPGVNVIETKIKGIGFTVLNWGGYTDANDYTPKVWTKFSGSIFLLGASHNNTMETYAPAFTTIDAYNIDLKIDDGLPAQGKMVVSAPVLFTSCVSSTNSTIATYVITNSGNNCGFMIDAGF